MNEKFLFTDDKDTRNNLLKLGFTEIPSGESFFMFINNSTLKFDDSINTSNNCSVGLRVTVKVLNRYYRSEL